MNEYSIPDHCKVLQEPSNEILQIAHWLITIPGTSTAQAMYTETPTIVLLPLNRPDLLIFDGLLGLLAKVPLLGRLIRYGVITYSQRYIPYFSLPNKRAGQRIIPEYVQTLSAQDIADIVVSHSQNKPERQSVKDALSAIKPTDTMAYDIISEIGRDLSS